MIYFVADINSKIHKEKLMCVIKENEGMVTFLSSVKFNSWLPLNFAKLNLHNMQLYHIYMHTYKTYAHIVLANTYLVLTLC